MKSRWSSNHCQSQALCLWSFNSERTVKSESKVKQDTIAIRITEIQKKIYNRMGKPKVWTLILIRGLLYYITILFDLKLCTERLKYYISLLSKEVGEESASEKRDPCLDLERKAFNLDIWSWLLGDWINELMARLPSLPRFRPFDGPAYCPLPS